MFSNQDKLCLLRKRIFYSNPLFYSSYRKMKAIHFKNWIKIYFHIPLLTHEEWHKIKNVLNHLQILVTKLGGSTNFYKNNFKSYKMTQTLVWPPTLTEYTNTWDISKSIKLSWDDLIQNLVEPQTDTNRF